MENTNATEQSVNDSSVFEVTRRIRGSKAKSIVGFILFVFGLAFVLGLISFACSGGTDSGLIVCFIILTVLSFVIGAVLQTKKSEEGTLTFYPDKIVFSGNKTKLELYVSEISVAQKKADVLKIVAANTTLVVIADQADEIALKIRELLHTADGDDSVSVTEQTSEVDTEQPQGNEEEESSVPSPKADAASTPAEKAEALREYKKLVDEGVLTKEQFDEIVKKLV